MRDVLGHMTATAKMTPPRFFLSMAAAGFRFNTMTAKGVAAEETAKPADGLANFRGHLKDTTHPPGPVEAMLGEAVIHPADIRTPLGIAHEYPEEALIRVADFYKGSNLIVGAKRRIDGLTLRATDTGWSTGSGPAAGRPSATSAPDCAARLPASPAGPPSTATAWPGLMPSLRGSGVPE